MGATAALLGFRPTVEREPVTAQTDDYLVARVRAGDDAGFEAIYDRYARGVLAFCVHMLGSREAAEDALQLTFVSAYRVLRGGSSDVSLRPWLYTIARNRCLSQLRARRDVADVDEVATDGPFFEGVADQVQRREELREMLEDIQRLPADQRAALVLFELGDHPHKEIAAVLGVRTEKVKALIFQAREALVRGRTARNRPCVEIRERLATLHGRVLPRSVTRAHIDRCPSCAAFEGEVRRQRAALALILPVPLAVELKASVLGSALRGGGAVAAGVGACGSGGAAAGGGACSTGAFIAGGVTTAGGAGGGGAVAVSAGAAGSLAGAGAGAASTAAVAGAPIAAAATGLTAVGECASIGVGGLGATGFVAKILAVAAIATGAVGASYASSRVPHLLPRPVTGVQMRATPGSPATAPIALTPAPATTAAAPGSTRHHNVEYPACCAGLPSHHNIEHTARCAGLHRHHNVHHPSRWAELHRHHNVHHPSRWAELHRHHNVHHPSRCTRLHRHHNLHHPSRCTKLHGHHNLHHPSRCTGLHQHHNLHHPTRCPGLHRHHTVHHPRAGLHRHYNLDQPTRRTGLHQHHNLDQPTRRTGLHRHHTVHHPRSGLHRHYTLHHPRTGLHRHHTLHHPRTGLHRHHNLHHPTHCTGLHRQHNLDHSGGRSSVRRRWHGSPLTTELPVVQFAFEGADPDVQAGLGWRSSIQQVLDARLWLDLGRATEPR